MLIYPVPMGKYKILDVLFHWCEYKLNKEVWKLVEGCIVAMISKCTFSIPNEVIVFSRLLYLIQGDSGFVTGVPRYFKVCGQRSQVLSGLSSALPCLLPVLPSAARCCQVLTGKSFRVMVTEICNGHGLRTTICYWYYWRTMAHYRFITVSYGISWYFRLYYYCLQDIIASCVWESQLTHTIFNIYLDSDKLVFTYNNDKSQLHVISEQPCY